MKRTILILLGIIVAFAAVSQDQSGNYRKSSLGEDARPIKNGHGIEKGEFTFTAKAF